MATADETLRATLSETEYGALELLAASTVPRSGRNVAAALGVAPTTANDALATLREAGFATSSISGRATHWRLAVSTPTISDWLTEVTPAITAASAGASPYSTGGGGVRLEHTYAACLISKFLAGESLAELGDSLEVDTVRLQASDVSEPDDIYIEGHDSNGEIHRASISVRRNPALTKSDTESVPLIRDFVGLLTDNWLEISTGRWKLVLAVSTNANAITQLGELAELAHSLPSGEALANRLSQPSRTNARLRGRYGHIKALVGLASKELRAAEEIGSTELTWRLLYGLSTRSLRLERTDRTDRTFAVNALQHTLTDGTPGVADALFSRIEELVGEWAPQGAILTQSVVRARLSNFRLSRSENFASAWQTFDRFGARLRDSVNPGLQSGAQSLEFERIDERARLVEAMRAVGTSASVLVVSGEPDVGKSALSLRSAESLREQGAAVTSLSLRDIPTSVIDLETQLGGSALDDVMASGETRPIRLLLIDGAESVLEGKGQVFRGIATAALRAGLGVVAVTRTDGSKQVRDELMNSSRLTGSSVAPIEHSVEQLTDDERATLPRTFTALARLSGDNRANWLLGRPGLVDALLRTGETLDPDKFLCEADVFAAVWRSLIRRDEIREVGTASPDDREHAALSVAKRALGITADVSHGTASAELRTDGVLRAPSNPALSPGDEFSSDLFRDFALCRLFITHGWDPLASAAAPRWSIRAARIGCQAAIANGDRSHSWLGICSSFDAIAQESGERWQEVPYEALLTLGDAESAIRQVWDALVADDSLNLNKLLRVSRSRYVNGDIGDRFALSPIVKVAYCEGQAIDSRTRVGQRSMDEVLKDIVLAWLRGMALNCPSSDLLRQQVRDVILDSAPKLYDDFAIEALASLASDLDDRAEAWLRDVAANSPAHLNPAIESFTVAISMSATHPQLLLDLTEAYYIETPDLEDPWGGGRDLMDDGIRDFRHGLTPGYGIPAAAWFYGPFFRLLNTIPIEATSFINRMLDHAAKSRVERTLRRRKQVDGTEELEGLSISLPGIGRRRYVGDSHVWAWYRGTSVGSYPCVSALLALERFVDHLLENAEVPARTIFRMLLRDCHNLAVPGLLVGFLTRHLRVAGQLLDPFLASPYVWNLEIARATGDFSFRVRDSDADKLTGADRRTHTFHETVGSMVVNARLTGDEERLTQLRAVGAKLIEAAQSQVGDATNGSHEYLATVESWAAEFEVENYRLSRTEGEVFIQFERPMQIERVLAPITEDLQATNQLYGLQNRYGRYNDDPARWPIENLNEDLAIARGIDERDEIPNGFLWPENGLVSVAAAAVRAHALNQIAIEPANLEWAVEAVMLAAENPVVDATSYPGTMFPMAADRAAAASAPMLALEPFDVLNLDRPRLDACLKSLAASLFNEVRAIYVNGCRPVWDAPCERDEGADECKRHYASWIAATTGLADCRLGPWDTTTQSRVPDPLPFPFHESLTSLGADELLVDRLRMPLACMVDARKTPCLQRAVAELWAPLWDAHCRGLANWWKEGYDRDAQTSHDPASRRMIQTVLDGDSELIRSHIEACAADSHALHLLFEGFATNFTYDAELRASMADFWPWALKIALDAVGDGAELRMQRHWFDYMVAALLPTPNARSMDRDIDSTFTQCRDSWLQPEALGELAERWLHLARWEAKAVDATVSFAKGTSLTWQTTTGLIWIERIIDGRFDLIANRLWLLEEWLTDLRATGALVDEARSRYHRLIDGLAAAGDRASVRLQQLDE